ncbi:MAG TPA: hypothetical protein IAB38_01705 [Candidatus Onthousia excrementipullorum]|uniref:Uncharacterized protein n=1 Tax=Candidatus Onthousia excrementipullorum TaxID=2840884 RepID=A0A9D1DTM2_9FIRM|nr:hypothetical protein [Candidatus Onthousia excrementipullorum]
MYQKYYRRHMIKSAIIIIFLFAFAIISTYLIYNNFSSKREHDIDTGEMEVVFHGKEGNKINLTKFTPVSDAVGLSSTEYSFTVKNSTANSVSYKIVLEPNTNRINSDECFTKTIPSELLKLSLRVDHQTPVAKILSEYQDNVLYEDTLEADSEEDYSIRLWAINSDFVIDRDSHYHAVIKVIEEG